MAAPESTVHVPGYTVYVLEYKGTAYESTVVGKKPTVTVPKSNGTVQELDVAVQNPTKQHRVFLPLYINPCETCRK